ncbi:hypothetical protein HOLleu_00543 [Holothuria leucospilota]|uniref:Uncharacterized protein n=1 Tax=Holothuria leucospilota TaxID=206669 RepID=A0A9Q1CP96_HOLLE|nr:hypothetical protein HOLleu_00543 [Holothuria leucospilota]
MERMAPFTPPFCFTACYYFGPYIVKIGRNKTKHYGVIFTCLNTRSVHLLLAVDCSATEFLQVLGRTLNCIRLWSLFKRGHNEVTLCHNCLRGHPWARCACICPVQFGFPKRVDVPDPLPGSFDLIGKFCFRYV